MPEFLRPLPLFYKDFPTLRRDDAVYIDKTAMLSELCRGRAQNFLARLRRFGKTLLVSTFESLFKTGCVMKYIRRTDAATSKCRPAAAAGCRGHVRPNGG